MSVGETKRRVDLHIAEKKSDFSGNYFKTKRIVGQAGTGRFQHFGVKSVPSFPKQLFESLNINRPWWKER